MFIVSASFGGCNSLRGGIWSFANCRAQRSLRVCGQAVLARRRGRKKSQNLAPGTSEAPFRPHLLSGACSPLPSMCGSPCWDTWPAPGSHGAFPAVAPRSGKRRVKTQTCDKWSRRRACWQQPAVRSGAAAPPRCVVGPAAPVRGWPRGRRGPGTPGRAAARPAHSWPGRRARRAPCASSWLRAGRSERRELGEEPGPAAAALPVIGLLCCNFA